jgi:hypothetical protein
VLGESVNVEVVEGSVRINLPGDKQGFRPLGEEAQVPVGSTVDVRDGRIALTSAAIPEESGAGSSAATQTAEFYDGVFTVRQGKKNDRTTLKLDELLDCGGGGSAEGRDALRRRPRPGNGLWGNGSGNFSTQGGHGSATVRGTVWFTFNRCGGITGTRVRRGTVLFRDFYLDETVVVEAGETAVAKPPE